MRARRKKDLRLKNVNNLPSEAQEINNWTIVYPLNLTHKVGRTTRKKLTQFWTPNLMFTQVLYNYFAMYM